MISMRVHIKITVILIVSKNKCMHVVYPRVENMYVIIYAAMYVPKVTG